MNNFKDLFIGKRTYGKRKCFVVFLDKIISYYVKRKGKEYENDLFDLRLNIFVVISGNLISFCSLRLKDYVL